VGSTARGAGRRYAGARGQCSPTGQGDPRPLRPAPAHPRGRCGSPSDRRGLRQLSHRGAAQPQEPDPSRSCDRRVRGLRGDSVPGRDGGLRMTLPLGGRLRW
jgi:hypothetical protein